MGTIQKEFEVTSVALMSGQNSCARVCPAEEKGIRFHFQDNCIEAKIENVVSTEHCAVIGNEKAKIMLIEHFMAACSICKINSLDVYLSHYELPILDGASKIWIENFRKSGILGAENTIFKVKEPVYYLEGKTHLVILPSDKLNLVYSVNYNHTDLKNRWIALDENNIQEIIEARTFGYLNELEAMQKMGYGRGADIENTLGLKDNGEYTSNLKSEFEPIKHKILDLIGDFYLIGCRTLDLKAQIIVKEAGHTVHVKTAKMLQDKIIMEE